MISYGFFLSDPFIGTHGSCSNFGPKLGQFPHGPHGLPPMLLDSKDLMSQLERLEGLRPGTAKRLKVRSFFFFLQRDLDWLVIVFNGG